MHRGRHPVPLRLSDADRARLLAWARRRTTAQAVALRARIVLACADTYRAQLDELRAVGRCDCGCPTADFARAKQLERGAGGSQIVADVYGATPEGYAVGLMLWQRAGWLSGLEVYSLADHPPYGLPAPDTVADVPAGWDPAG